MGQHALSASLRIYTHLCGDFQWAFTVSCKRSQSREEKKKKKEVCVRGEGLFELHGLRQPTSQLSKQRTQIQCPRKFFSTPKIKVWGFLECVCEQDSSLSTIQLPLGVMKEENCTKSKGPLKYEFRFLASLTQLFTFSAQGYFHRVSHWNGATTELYQPLWLFPE